MRPAIETHETEVREDSTPYSITPTSQAEFLVSGTAKESD